MHSDPVLAEIAAEKKCSAAQVAIAWAVKRGTIPLVKTSRVERLTENIAAAHVDLTEADMAKIDALNCDKRVFNPINWPGQRNMPYFQ